MPSQMNKMVITLFFFFALCTLVFSQAENITITTYYPSPYGSYVELRAQQMAIGATYFDQISVCWGGAPAGCPGGSVDPTAATDLVVEGRVGIGTKIPTTALEINGSHTFNKGILYVKGISTDSFIVTDTDNAANRSGIGLNNGNANVKWWLYIPGGSNDLRLIDGLAALDILTFQSGTGNVGIGTTTPGYLLDVNGQIRTTNDSPIKPTGGVWAAPSDKRLKKDIKPLRGALEKISQLQGSTFKWINPQLHVAGERAGVIGQDLQKVFPEWVSHVKPEGEDKDLIPAGEDALVVAFPGDFNAYLIEALKELKSENDALKARITALEAKLNVRQ